MLQKPNTDRHEEGNVFYWTDTENLQNISGSQSIADNEMRVYAQKWWSAWESTMGEGNMPFA